MFDDALVTVWSAPNYCYRCGNLASIMTVHDDGSREFTVYAAAPENERDKGMQLRKMVSECTCRLSAAAVLDLLITLVLLWFADGCSLNLQGTMPYFV